MTLAGRMTRQNNNGLLWWRTTTRTTATLFSFSCLCALLIPSGVVVSGFGILSSSSDIQIVGLPGGGPQSLPLSYVQRFQRWSMEKGEEEGDDNEMTLKKLKGLDSDDDDGFVNPTSTTELWWPSDIEDLEVRPTLDVLVQSGIPVYASGGLHVRVPPKAAADGMEWRNYGMNSQPLARQWTTFGFAVEPEFRVETFLGSILQNDDNNVDDNEGKAKWTALKSSTADDMKQTLGSFAEFLSSVDEDSPLSSGFHVISIPTVPEWSDLPQKSSSPFALVALATAEPDAKELLTMDSDLVAMTATSILAVQVSQIEAGAKSEYITDTYKPLYL